MGCGDMMVSDDRTKFMRYGIGPRDLIGITDKPNVMTNWALSLHICCRLPKFEELINTVDSTQYPAGGILNIVKTRRVPV